jgi:hypothetical protein
MLFFRLLLKSLTKLSDVTHYLSQEISLIALNSLSDLLSVEKFIVE